LFSFRYQSAYFSNCLKAYLQVNSNVSNKQYLVAAPAHRQFRE
jgi:hypothetical protein